MRDGLAGIIVHGRRELAQAETALGRHQPADNGLCACMRALPCRLAEQWEAWAVYWRARLAEHEREAVDRANRGPGEPAVVKEDQLPLKLDR